MSAASTGMGNAVQIKVDPQTLLSKAGTVEAKTKDIKNRLDTVSSIVKGTASYWNGEAANLHRKDHESFKPLADEMIARLTEHIADLRQISGIYSEAETQVSSQTQALPKDAIE